MKKFLLSAFAVAVAFSAAAFQMLPNRPVMTPKAFNGKIEKVAKPAPKMLLKPMAKISSLDDISGSYVMMYYDYFDDYAQVWSEVTITKTATDTYKITGWWGSWTNDIVATVDQTEGTVTIQRQEIYRYETSSHVEAADLVNVNSEDEEAMDDPLIGDIYMDAIIFEVPWGAVITEYSEDGVTEEDAIGQYFVIGVYAYLLEPNGTMTWTPVNTSTGEGETPETVNVYLEQINDTVFINNFYGIGSTVYAVLAEGRTFAIPPQVIYTSSNGEFKTTEILSWYNDDEYTDITGTGTDNTLTDNLEMGWTAGTTTGYWIGWNSNLIINRTDTVFIWPGEEVVIPDVYILGEVGENTWATNVGQKMELDEETNLYTAEIVCDGRNDGYNFFKFSTKLLEAADDWDGIAPYMFGAVSDGDFLVTDEMLGIDLSLTNENGQAYKIPAGTYDLTLNYADMKLMIAKLATPITLGDANEDGEVNVNDVTTIINYILQKNPTPFNFDNADVNGDGEVNVMDVTTIINMILGVN